MMGTLIVENPNDTGGKGSIQVQPSAQEEGPQRSPQGTKHLQPSPQEIKSPPTPILQGLPQEDKCFTTFYIARNSRHALWTFITQDHGACTH